MNETIFWSIIEESKLKDQSGEEQHEFLTEILSKYTVDDIGTFQDIWYKKYAKADRKEIYFVAYIIGGGRCSDDSWMDFRYGLIGQGKDFYENTLKEPRYFGEPKGEIFYEELGYAADCALEEKTKEELDLSSEDLSEEEEEEEEDWDWDGDKNEILEKYPELCKKYNFK